MSFRDKRRKFGQNYLIDPAILYEMEESINPQAHDRFIEIGPGMGALTKILNKESVHITAIDIDRDNIAYLEKSFHGPAEYNFIQSDILRSDFAFLNSNDHRVVGNLPYNISTQIIIKLINYFTQIKDMHFLIQREVAEKITGSPGSKDWGKLSIKLSAFFDTQILFDVPPEAFDIKPKVTSSFIRISPKRSNRLDLSFKKDLYKVVDWSFISRRKNIRNNLKKRDVNWDLLDINNNLRPEEVCLEDYMKLAEALKE